MDPRRCHQKQNSAPSSRFVILHAVEVRVEGTWRGLLRWSLQGALLTPNHMLWATKIPDVEWVPADCGGAWEGSIAASAFSSGGPIASPASQTRTPRMWTLRFFEEISWFLRRLKFFGPELGIGTVQHSACFLPRLRWQSYILRAQRDISDSRLSNSPLLRLPAFFLRVFASSGIPHDVVSWWRRVLDGGQPAQPVHQARSGRQEPAA